MRLFYKKMQFFISFSDISLVMLFPYTNIPVINDIKLNTSVSSLYFLNVSTTAAHWKPSVCSITFCGECDTNRRPWIIPLLILKSHNCDRNNFRITIYRSNDTSFYRKIIFSFSPSKLITSPHPLLTNSRCRNIAFRLGWFIALRIRDKVSPVREAITHRGIGASAVNMV